MADLKRKSVRGGALTITSQAISIGIQLTSTVILARLLLPDDYGMMAMIMAVTALAGIFRDLGLSSAAIQKKDLTHAQQSNLFWLNIAIGTLFTILVAAASPVVAAFYGEPELIWVNLTLSSGFLLSSIGALSNTLLIRNLQFGRQMIITTTGALVSLGVSVTLANLGFAHWSLVWGSLSGAAIGTIVLFFLSPFRPQKFMRGAGTFSMIRFGANVTGFSVINYFHRNLDNILLGKFWGADVLGIYSRAYSLLMLPINSLRGPVETIGYPALSKLQHNPAEFRNYYRKIVRLLALASIPFSALLFCASKSLIEIALGPEWSAVSGIFSYLALVALIQPVVSLWGIVMLSLGLTQRYLKIGVYNTIVTSIAFIIGLPWGAEGVAISYVVATYINCFPVLYFAFRNTPLKISDLTSEVYRPLVASVFGIIICRFAITIQTPSSPIIELVVIAIYFGIGYLATMCILPGGMDNLRYLIKILAEFIRKKPQRFDVGSI